MTQKELSRGLPSWSTLPCEEMLGDVGLVQPGEETASGRPSSAYKEVIEEMERFTEMHETEQDSGLVRQKQVPSSHRGFNVCQPWA